MLCSEFSLFFLFIATRCDVPPSSTKLQKTISLDLPPTFSHVLRMKVYQLLPCMTYLDLRRRGDLDRLRPRSRAQNTIILYFQLALENALSIVMASIHLNFVHNITEKVCVCVCVCVCPRAHMCMCGLASCVLCQSTSFSHYVHSVAVIHSNSGNFHTPINFIEWRFSS